MKTMQQLQHFLTMTELTPESLTELLALAKDMKRQPAVYQNALSHKKIALLFEKASTRTRLSFEVGVIELGGHPVVLSGADMQIGRGEPLSDTIQVMSRYVDALMIRTCGHDIVETFGTREGKILTYIGDGNNMAHSLMIGGALSGMEIRICTPAAYAPDPQVVHDAQAIAKETGGSIVVLTDPEAAANGADVVYTDVFASMGQEEEATMRLQAFEGYQVNAQIMDQANDDAIFLHCLPAHRGEEVTAGVIDGSQSVVFDQAENRLHAQKALLVTLLG